MSIYRSAAGKRAIERVYESGITALPFDVDSQYVDTRHGRTHVLLAGPADGRPVVVFHGGNSTNPLSLAWYADLADEYRIVAPDTIGQPGLSAETRVDPRGDGYGEWVVDLLDAVDLGSGERESSVKRSIENGSVESGSTGLDSVPMIGTSYGSGIVLRTAAYAPERIDRAALVVPAGFGTGSLVPMARIGLPALAYRFVPSAWLLERVLTSMVTATDPDPLLRETVATSLRHVALEREFPGAEADELEEFTAPVTLFAAENDPFFPADAIVPRARALLSTLDRVEVLEDERHIPSPVAQDRVTSIIRECFR